MRVNVYAEEITDRVEIIGKDIDGHKFTGLRFFLELPATVNGEQYRGPFQHRPGDDDSSAVTFWGKRDLRAPLRKGLELLDAHYEKRAPEVLPAIGTDYDEGIYAGTTLHAGAPHALVLLPNTGENLTWEKAKAWATEQAGDLPTRIDMLVLWKNVRDRFRTDDWYWTSELHESDAEYAWMQAFSNGGQSYLDKGSKYLARAVRRAPI